MMRNNKKVVLSCAYAAFLLCAAADATPPVSPSSIVANRYYGVINSVRISGSSLFTEEVKEIASTAIGQSFSSKVENDLSKKIGDIYQNSGYILSYVNSIKLQGGVLSIEIYEGSVRNFIVESAQLADNKLLQEYIAVLKASKPFRLDSNTERAVALIKRLPGLERNPYYFLEFRPISIAEINRNDPKTIDLVLHDGYTEFSGTAHINNRYQPDYPSQMTAKNKGNVLYTGAGVNADLTADWNNPLNRGDMLRVATAFAGQRDVASGSAQYKYQLNSLGSNLSVAAAGAKSKTDNTTASFANIAFSHPIYLKNTRSLDFSTFISTYTENDKAYDAKYKIKVPQIGASLLWQHTTANNIKYSFGSGVQYGLSALDQRIGSAKQSFVKTLMSAGFRIPFANFELTFSADAQSAPNYIPRVERMVIGQTRGGRGLQNGSMIGNNAITTTTELSYIHHFKHRYFLAARPYVFVDGAYAVNEVPKSVTTDFKKNATKFVSTGLGNTLYLYDNINLTLEVSKPLVLKQKSKDTTFDKKVKVVGEIGYNFRF